MPPCTALSGARPEGGSLSELAAWEAGLPFLCPGEIQRPEEGAQARCWGGGRAGGRSVLKVTYHPRGCRRGGFGWGSWGDVSQTTPLPFGGGGSRIPHTRPPPDTLPRLSGAQFFDLMVKVKKYFFLSPRIIRRFWLVLGPRKVHNHLVWILFNFPQILVHYFAFH